MLKYIYGHVISILYSLDDFGLKMLEFDTLRFSRDIGDGLLIVEN